MTDARGHYAFASDNTAGICPEALAALAAANAGRVPSYGDDPHTTEARRRFAEVFERECDVFFVFNGTAANALALAALCQRHHGVLCHALAHIETDECAAPEFFTGGAKLLPLDAPHAKLRVSDLAPQLTRGHGVHFSKLRALSLTQATELGTLYTPEETRALCEFAHAQGWAVHMDGARFANAAAAFAMRGEAGKGREASGPENAPPTPHVAAGARPARAASPADLTWRAGVDVLSFGGTKNGLLTTEAVVFFNRELAREFDYRVKQSGQLASKMRFASAQWAAVLREGAWLRHAAHANRQAQKLAAGLVALGFALVEPVEVNGVFVRLPPAVFAALAARGWHFYKFIGEDGYRLMCSWDTRDEDVAAFIADARDAASA
jgi:threonine aldolase